MSKNEDAAVHIQELKDLVVAFRRERNWDKHFTPKNVATSIAIEAAELLELYQWDLLIKEDKRKAEDELADVIIFAFHFATVCNIDIAHTFKRKLAAAGKKYPTNVFNAKNDGFEEYHQAKAAYRKAKK